MLLGGELKGKGTPPARLGDVLSGLCLGSAASSATTTWATDYLHPAAALGHEENLEQGRGAAPWRTC